MNKRNWLEFVSDDVFIRLCDCRTIKDDLRELVDAKWYQYQLNGRAIQGYTKEDALISVLELLDSNGCYIDLTKDEYNELKKV